MRRCGSSSKVKTAAVNPAEELIATLLTLAAIAVVLLGFALPARAQGPGETAPAKSPAVKPVKAPPQERAAGVDAKIATLSLEGYLEEVKAKHLGYKAATESASA
ncbi:MAG TPA: hypothetical protein VFV50_02405, partial [Bdellovibrionales bacterium]|nr:hypothetical protein [Bdellovibrionales bacterium]